MANDLTTVVRINTSPTIRDNLKITCDSTFVGDLLRTLPCLAQADMELVEVGGHRFFHQYLVPFTDLDLPSWRTKLVCGPDVRDVQVVAKIYSYLQSIKPEAFLLCACTCESSDPSLVPLPATIHYVSVQNGQQPNPRENQGSEGHITTEEWNRVERVFLLPRTVNQPTDSSILVDPKRFKKGDRSVPPDQWRQKSWPTKLLGALHKAGLPLLGWGFAVSESGFERVRIVPEKVQATLNWLAQHQLHAQEEVCAERPLAILRVRKPAQVKHCLEEVASTRSMLTEQYHVKRWIRHKITGDTVEWFAEMENALPLGEETTFRFENGLRVDWLSHRSHAVSTTILATIEKAMQTPIISDDERTRVWRELHRHLLSKRPNGVVVEEEVDRLFDERSDKAKALIRNIVVAKSHEWASHGYGDEVARKCVQHALAAATRAYLDAPDEGDLTLIKSTFKARLKTPAKYLATLPVGGQELGHAWGVAYRPQPLDDPSSLPITAIAQMDVDAVADEGVGRQMTPTSTMPHTPAVSVQSPRLTTTPLPSSPPANTRPVRQTPTVQPTPPPRVNPMQPTPSAAPSLPSTEMQSVRLPPAAPPTQTLSGTSAQSAPAVAPSPPSTEVQSVCFAPTEPPTLPPSVDPPRLAPELLPSTPASAQPVQSTHAEQPPPSSRQPARTVATRSRTREQVCMDAPMRHRTLSAKRGRQETPLVESVPTLRSRSVAHPPDPKRSRTVPPEESHATTTGVPPEVNQTTTAVARASNGTSAWADGPSDDDDEVSDKHVPGGEIYKEFHREVGDGATRAVNVPV